MPLTLPATEHHPIMLFDGVCNLCHGGVNYIIDHDPGDHFRFAAQQSAAGRELMRRYRVPNEAMKSVVVIEGRKCYMRSSAILRIGRGLGGIHRLLATMGAAIPAFLSDWIYDWVAGNRYRWFGRTDACRMPNPDHAARFIESA